MSIIETQFECRAMESASQTGCRKIRYRGIAAKFSSQLSIACSERKDIYLGIGLEGVELMDQLCFSIVISQSNPVAVLGSVQYPSHRGICRQPTRLVFQRSPSTSPRQVQYGEMISVFEAEMYRSQHSPGSRSHKNYQEGFSRFDRKIVH